MAATTLAVAALATSAVAGAYGSYAQANAQKAQGIYQKGIADANAKLTELQADYALQRGKEEAGAIRSQVQRLKGTQRASYAGQGVAVDRGTALEIQDDAHTLGELDAITAKNNAWREAWGYRAQASNLRMQGAFAKKFADSQFTPTLITGGLNAASDALRAGYYLKKG